MPVLLLGFLPEELLVIFPLPNDCAGTTKLILFQMEGFAGVAGVGGQLGRWNGVSVHESHLLGAVLRRVLLQSASSQAQHLISSLADLGAGGAGYRVSAFPRVPWPQSGLGRFCGVFLKA